MKLTNILFVLAFIVSSCQNKQQPVEQEISIEEAFEQCEVIPVDQEHLMKIYDDFKDVDLVFIYEPFDDGTANYELTRLNKLEFDDSTVIGFLEVGTLETSKYPITKTGNRDGQLLIREECFNEVLEQYPELVDKLQQAFVGIPDVKKFIEDLGMDYDSVMQSMGEKSETKSNSENDNSKP